MPLTDTPTIWDMLGWEDDDDNKFGNEWTNPIHDTRVDEEGKTWKGVYGYEDYTPKVGGGGQGDKMAYLTDLLFNAEGDNPLSTTSPEVAGRKPGFFEWFGSEFLNEPTEIDRYSSGGEQVGIAKGYGGMDEDKFLKMASGLFSYEEGTSFQDLSSESIQKYLGDYSWDLSSGDTEYGPHNENIGSFSDPEQERLLELIQKIQEGFKFSPTSESFGLERKIGDIETSGKRDVESAYSGYIPGEILSRYGDLQNKPGAKEIGESKEQDYTSDIYGVQRSVDRDITGTYGEFEDEVFGGTAKWLESIYSDV